VVTDAVGAASGVRSRNVLLGQSPLRQRQIRLHRNAKHRPATVRDTTQQVLEAAIRCASAAQLELAYTSPDASTRDPGKPNMTDPRLAAA
jgi:hypothetical protein